MGMAARPSDTLQRIRCTLCAYFVEYIRRPDVPSVLRLSRTRFGLLMRSRIMATTCGFPIRSPQNGLHAKIIAVVPHRLCPSCRKPGRLLPDSSHDAVVEYYRCDDCNQVWSHQKAVPESPPKQVTVKGRS